MTQEHPITPPPELVKQWEGTAYNAAPIPYTHHIARCAARWGADQELEACCEWLDEGCYNPYYIPKQLRAARRAARRPKPPSLKEQALQALENADGADHPVVATVLTADQHALIRKALEQLND